MYPLIKRQTAWNWFCVVFCGREGVTISATQVCFPFGWLRVDDVALEIIRTEGVSFGWLRVMAGLSVDERRGSGAEGQRSLRGPRS